MAAFKYPVSASGPQSQEEWKELFALPAGSLGKKTLAEAMESPGISKMPWKGGETREMDRAAGNAPEKRGSGYLFTLKGSPDWYFAREKSDGSITVWVHGQQAGGENAESAVFAGKVIELTAQNFHQEIKKGWVIVDFYGPRCGPCKRMEPRYEEAAAELAGKVKFTKINAPDNGEIMWKYWANAWPTLIIFKDGEQVAKQIGGMDKDGLIRYLRKNGAPVD